MLVLVAVLDWGLGHATRCVPLIWELRRQGCEVIIGGSGDALLVLQKEFPTLKSVSLPGYRPRYPRQGKSMALAMVMQLPRFIKVIAAEHRAIEAIVDREKIDLVISDNRYGCWSENVHSIFITHQNNILMPKRFGWLGRPVRRLNEKLVRRFDSCWIPDFPNTHALAGALADPGTGRLKNNVQHIGWLSRFKPRQEAAVKYDVTAVLSGPEPQRTLLESTVLPQLQSSGLRYRVVRGLPSIATTPADNNVVNFLASGELQECIEASAVIIARSGYSTVMDMHALGKSVIFIPTPGQTEQEYLARRLKSKGIAFYMKQEEFDLTTALLENKRYSGFTILRSENLLRETVSSILKSNPEFDR